MAQNHPPGPASLNPLSNVLAFQRDICGYLLALQRKYGDFAYFRLGHRRMYLVCEPASIHNVFVANHRNFVKSRGLKLMGQSFLGQGLLTSDGDFHRRQRKLVQPAFHGKRLAHYGEIMASYSLRYRDGWRQSEPIDMDKEMMRLTMEIVAKALFDADVGEEADEIGAAMDEAVQLFQQVGNPLLSFLMKLPLPQNRRLADARARIDRTVFRIIEERRRSGEDRGDLLSMLLAAHYEDDGSGMSDQQIRDETVTLFMAGHETTANALTWTWYLLSQHREVRTRMHEEIDRVLGNSPPTAEDTRRLPYTRQVFAESMRLYPPAHLIGRQALAGCELGGYLVPARGTVLISPYVMHRHLDYWDDPERFDPGRWETEAVQQLPKHVYLPFGGGPRTCIGEPFAWMEGILVLAALAQAWEFDLVPGHPVALQPLITLRPRHGMRMIPRKRQPADVVSGPKTSRAAV